MTTEGESAALSAARVRTQLDRIVSSAEFRNSERLQRFLKATVDAALAGQSAELKEYTIGRDVFDRGPGYDPRTDSIVRVEARRLRRKLTAYYEVSGAQDPVRITFTPGSYVPIFSEPGDAPAPAPAAAAHATLDPNTVAVLPFANLSADTYQDYFCDGIAEDIINALTTVPELKVIGRASTFTLRGARQDIREIGEKLGAGTIVEGSLRRAGNTLRVSAKVMNAETRVALWSGTFDRPVGDVFAIKDEIASSIAATLRVTLGVPSRPPLRDGTPSIEAYTLYLKGLQSANRLDLPSYKTAIELFSRAISLFPDYALAYAAISDLYASSALISVMRPIDVVPRAKRAALEALRLDPALAQAFAGLGWIAFFFDRQWDQGIALTRHAVALAPSYAFGHFARGACYTILGRFEQALAFFEIALRLDPLSFRITRGLAWTLSAAGRFAEADQRARAAIDLEPNSAEPYYMQALIFLHQRRTADALASIRKAQLGSPTPLARGLEAAILAATGDRKFAEKILLQLESSSEWVDPIILSRVSLELGDIETALDQLSASMDERSPLAPYVATDPLYHRVRSNRRFRELVQSFHFPQAVTQSAS